MKWTSLGIVFLLGACASAPKVERPDLNLETPAAWSNSTVATDVDIDHWWKQLGDARLDTLIAQALASNYDLSAAASRLAQAQAQARIAGAPLRPGLSASGSGSRRKQNSVGFPIPGSDSQVLSTTSTNYGVHLNLSWEIDLWGKLRAGARAALADAQAAEADFYGAQLSLAAQTSRAYFASVEARRQVELSRATVDNYRLSSEQINSRYQRGLSSSLELRLGRSNQAAAEATLAQRRQLFDRSLRQLELLLGRYPSARIATGEQLPSVIEPVPAGLPADLVARRPDLAAAERRLAAATGRLAQSRRALFPSISLTASTGTSSSALGDLLDGDFSVWNLAANISQPLLQGGRLRAGVDFSQAGVDGALATYAQSALKAYAEVELALAAESFLTTQEQALKTASSEALAARVLAEDRYAKGLSDLTTLLDAQRRAFDAESRLLSVRRQRLDSRIDLYLALGGGFVAPQTQQHAETTR
jgi:outer membrane protein, multidrug efflux system